MQAGHGRPRLAVASAPTTPDSPTIEPTERSMPAEQMTKVMPIASTPNTEVDRTMLKKLETERNTGDRNRHDGGQRRQHQQRLEAETRRRRRRVRARSAGGRARRELRTWAAL